MVTIEKYMTLKIVCTPAFSKLNDESFKMLFDVNVVLFGAYVATLYVGSDIVSC